MPPDGVPFTFISGGPGDTNSTGWVEGTSGLAEDSPPLVVVDQRGTGRSQPRLGCPELDERLDASQPYDARAEAYLAKVERCAQALRGEGIDLDGYDSVESAADFVELREALGYEQWDLYGLSYGARLAREIQRQDPEGVRRMHLDTEEVDVAPRAGDRRRRLAHAEPDLEHDRRAPAERALEVDELVRVVDAEARP